MQGLKWSKIKFGLKNNLKTFLTALVITITSLFSILTIMNSFLVEIPRGWLVFGTTLVIGALIGLTYGLKVTYPKVEIEIPMRSVGVKEVKIKFGDLFKEEDHIVISVNEFFDTKMGDRCPVDPQSLLGLFITKKMNNDNLKLDELIKRNLKRVDSEKISPRGKGKKNQKYPIGTVAIIDHGKQKSFLSVLCHYNDNNEQADANVLDLWTALEELWRICKINAGTTTVNIPLIGTRFARMGLEPKHILELIILSIFHSAKTQDFIFPIKIILYEDDYKNYDLKQIKKRWL